MIPHLYVSTIFICICWWKTLQGIKPQFMWSTQWQIGTGRQISYWFDAWNGILICEGRERPDPYYISLAEASNQIDIYPNYIRPQAQFNQNENCLTWRWEANDQYTVRSVYEAFISGGKIKWGFTDNWRLKISATVKTFLYLLMKNKLLTHEEINGLMHKRVFFYCDLACVTCAKDVVESALHIFCKCPKAIHVWRIVVSQLGVCIMKDTGTVSLTWFKSRDEARRAGMSNKTWGIFFAATCWALWKMRNKKLFEGRKYFRRWLLTRLYKMVWCGVFITRET